MYPAVDVRGLAADPPRIRRGQVGAREADVHDVDELAEGARSAAWASNRSNIFSGGVPYATPTPTSMRRRRSDSVQLVTFSAMRLALGTITSAPSQVRTVQARMPSCSTRPATSAIWTASPTLILRSNTISNPETKLFTTVCS